MVELLCVCVCFLIFFLNFFIVLVADPYFIFLIFFEDFCHSDLSNRGLSSLLVFIMVSTRYLTELVFWTKEHEKKKKIKRI